MITVAMTIADTNINNLINTNMKKIFLTLTVVGLVLTSCSSDGNSEEGGHEETHQEVDGHEHNHEDHDHGSSESTNRNIKAGAESNMADPIVDAYLEIKNGLSKDDKEATAKGAESLLAVFNVFDMTQLSEEQHLEFMDIIENSKEQAEHIVKSPIDHQREHFEALSVDMADLIKLVGTSKTLYQDFCPMVNGGRGAIWLSEVEAIENPYMGSKMLDCGEIQNKINL